MTKKSASLSRESAELPGENADDKHEVGQHSLPSGPVFGHEQLKALGLRLRQVRESRRWSLKRLSMESGVSVAAIQKIEVGMANSSLLTVLALSEALGEPMDRLVRTSHFETSARKFTHSAVPRRPTRDLELTGPLHDAQLRSRVVVVAAQTQLSLSPEPKLGPMFAYVLSGKVTVNFIDGATEILSAGDAVHLSIPEHMQWRNANKTDALILCVNDPRQPQDVALKAHP